MLPSSDRNSSDNWDLNAHSLFTGITARVDNFKRSFFAIMKQSGGRSWHNQSEMLQWPSLSRTQVNPKRFSFHVSSASDRWPSVGHGQSLTRSDAPTELQVSFFRRNTTVAGNNDTFGIDCHGKKISPEKSYVDICCWWMSRIIANNQHLWKPYLWSCYHATTYQKWISDCKWSNIYNFDSLCSSSTIFSIFLNL